MRIREMTRKAGRAVTHVWPPDWGGSYGRGDKFPTGDEGVLTRVERTGNSLSLTIRFNDREHHGPLEWDAPPSLEAVEAALRARVGQSIREIGDLEIQE